MPRTLAIGAALSLMLGCASQPAIPQESLRGWHRVEADEIRILGDVPRAQLEALSEELAQFASAAKRILSISDEPSRVPFTILVFRDPELMLRYTGRRWVAGQVRSVLDAHYALVGRSSAHSATRAVLFHEYMHFLLRKRRDYDYPRWFEEGLADYMSTLRVRDDVVIVGPALMDRLRRLRIRKMPPLPVLFTAELSVYDFYASSWGLVHLAVSDPAHRGKLAQLDGLLASGVPVRDASRQVFLEGQGGVSREEVDRHVERLARGVRHDLLLPLDELDPGSVGRAQPISASEAGYALGLVMLRFGDGDGELEPQAERFFRAALQLQPDSPHVRAGLAEAVAREGRFEESTELLSAALAAQDPDARVLLHASGAWAHRASQATDASAVDAWTACEAWAARALEKHARSPRAHALIGRARFGRGMPAEARVHLERARSLGARSLELDLELATVQIALGREAEARQLLSPLARDPHRPKLAQRAKALLEDLDGDAAVQD